MCTLSSEITHCVKSSHERSDRPSPTFLSRSRTQSHQTGGRKQNERFSKNCSVQILCPDVVELCQGDVKWESGIIPESCVEGPGWQGTLDLRFSDGFFILNWTALVKQAKCVHGVICSLVIRLDYMKDKYFLVKAKTKRIGNDIPFDTKCDNSTKAIEIKKGNLEYSYQSCFRARWPDYSSRNSCQRPWLFL